MYFKYLKPPEGVKCSNAPLYFKIYMHLVNICLYFHENWAPEMETHNPAMMFLVPQTHRQNQMVTKIHATVSAVSPDK